MKKLIHFYILFTFQLFSQKVSDTLIIKDHLIKIAQTTHFRNHSNIDQLNKTAEYIKTIFSNYSQNTKFQEFSVNGKIYKNVITSFGMENPKRIVIGAHYDVCGEQQGADDNASGVVGLLELARLLNNKKLNYRVDLVAYSLEEPPFFRSQYMGSYIHAQSLKNENADVFGMISLEMIGYFKEEKNTQNYPLKVLSLFYGSKGNYITIVKKLKGNSFVRQFSRKFIKTKKIRTKKISAPAKLPGIDFSDHLNYWRFGYNALMLTDTSFYRNKNYHQKSDTIETLNISQMKKVIDGVYETIIQL